MALPGSPENTPFVAGFRHDVFVSYATVDNKPLADAERGWVSTLVQGLRVILGRRLGRSDGFSVWWDESDLRGNHEITPEIREAVRGSATLLLVLSPGFCASDWCCRELELFFEGLTDGVEGRVFVVEMQLLDADQPVPPVLADLRGYRFWYRDERSRARTLSPRSKKDDYFALVEDVGCDLSARLKKMAGAAAQPVEHLATVYLAEVTEDLESRRDQVRRYLEHERVRVLPERRYLEGDAFREALERELEERPLFVQLLSEVPGRRPHEVPQGYVRLQLEQARDKGLRIMQWCEPDLSVREVEAEDQRELLQAESVFAESLEIFKPRIVRSALPPPSAEPAPIEGGAPFVFINFERRDQELAEEVRDHVAERALAVLPIRAGPPREIREDLEQKLKECDALLVVYGEGPLSWVDMQLMQCNRIGAEREQPLAKLAVYDGPPEWKPEVSTRMPGLEILPCRKGLDQQKLEEFLAPLLGGGS